MQDVILRHNLIRHVSNAFDFTGRTSSSLACPAPLDSTGRGARFTFRDNVAVDIDATRHPGRGYTFLWISGIQGVTIDHNTMLTRTGKIGGFVTEGRTSTGAIFTNNLTNGGYASIGCNGFPTDGPLADGAVGDAACIAHATPGGKYAKNIFFNASAGAPQNLFGWTVPNPKANYDVSDWNAGRGPAHVGMMNIQKCSQDDETIDYTSCALSPSSFFATGNKGQGTDNRSIGADIAAIKLRLSSVPNGVVQPGATR